MRLLIDCRYQPVPSDLVRAFIAAASDLDIHAWLPLARPDSSRTAWRGLLPHWRRHVAPALGRESQAPAGPRSVASELLESAAIAQLAPDIVWTPGMGAATQAPEPPPLVAGVSWITTGPLVPSPAADPHAQTQQRPALARHWQWLKSLTAIWVDEPETARALVDRLLLAASDVRHFTTATPADRAQELLQALPALVAGSARPRAPAVDSRPTLAFLSPLPPERSGIADYSAELLPELARHYRITLVSAADPTTDPWLSAVFPTIGLTAFRASAHRFDRILYQLGNSHFHAHMPELLHEHPGVVVLHDFFLGHLHGWRQLAGGEPFALNQALFAAHGWPALRTLAEQGAEAALWRFPANRDQLAAATGVIVHSPHGTALARDWLDPGLVERFHWVAHPRRPVPVTDRSAARAALGLAETDFIVCAFGYLGPSKRNLDLIDAWLASPLSERRDCRLVFVGQNADGDYGQRILARLPARPRGAPIRVTGFISPADYRHWLDGADLAVQLRALDRGETSRTVLDCLAHGLPLMLNAHGSMADFSTETVHQLADACSTAELSAALTALHADPVRRAEMARRGRADIARHHHPVAVAAAYRDVLERCARQSPVADYRRLIDRLGRLPGVAATPAELDALLEPLARLAPRDGPGRWYLDITALREAPHVTGIERVTQALLMALLRDPDIAARLVPVRAAGDGYRHAWDYVLSAHGLAPEALPAEPLLPCAGDLFLGLDWAPHAILKHQEQIAGWRRLGVRVWFMVHDILPATHPQWFPGHLPPLVRQWLDALARLADGCVCVSSATAAELAAWWGDGEGADPPLLRVSHNGADFLPLGAADPALGPNLEPALAARPSLLMVGTIEPRKGHAQVFAALERLWADGLDLNLIVVGREGWPNDTPAERRPIRASVDWLRTHPERDRRLFWPQDVDDATLAALYRRASALLAAAEGEGFGLPLIEAAHHGLPLIARDIPVFREIAGPHAWYFDAEPDPEGTRLADSLRAWLAAWRADQAPSSHGLSTPTWTHSATRLRDLLLTDQEPKEPLVGWVEQSETHPPNSKA
ncbi:glycosyltransferase [Thiocystis violacea]|uniref:glycosyltransferase n=1 Tax=Thiocystis violacea TaxID=13725 RepID=UPI00190618B7|nr:glycosyltransferase [Thiocystis violacea]MBK1719779.1 hypothetical protein [Thiocystis violacea]